MIGAASERMKFLNEQFEANTGYQIRVLAKSSYGVSQSTVEVDVFIPDGW